MVRSALTFVCLAVSPLVAAPSITGLANAASNITFNSPLAQGSIFIIKGAELGPATLLVALAPFQATTLGGTSVEVTVGATTVNALMYYTSAGQVAALLPSNTPTGTGTFTVIFNGQRSNSVSRGVAAANVGIFTINSSGSGPAIVTYPDYSLVSGFRAIPPAVCGGPNTVCGAANPGDTLILWATGLGSVSGSDASGAGLGQSMPNVPLSLWLGGVRVPIVYQGRSGCCIGEDQIVFTVPDNVPTGCGVPLVIQIGTGGNTVSNSTTLPVARGSRNCTPLAPGAAAVNVERLAATGTIAVGEVRLDKDLNRAGNGYEDSAKYEFFKLTLRPQALPFVASDDLLPPGTCTVENRSIGDSSGYYFSEFVALAGGASLSLRGPNGTATIPQNNGDWSIISPNGSILAPGTLTISGPGGRDVGAFTASIAVPALPTLTSPANTPNLVVNRSDGLTVTWQGGDPGLRVRITLFNSTDSSGSLNAAAECRVSARAGTFTIPPYVLSGLPATGFGSLGFGVELPGAFSAPGLDVGSLDVSILRTRIPITLR